MAYNQVSYGSTGSDVTELQKLLNKTNNGYNLSEDGKFGAKTQAAVKDYQKKNGLAVDGIVGKNTWGALTKSTTPTTPITTQQTTATTTSDGVSQPNWQPQLNETIDKILNREKFSYDVNGDALYQQYKDLYTNQGKQAMMDTMGQASAMTGGYGNSYAQTVGQQTYQGYLQQLNDKVPELYQLALDQYNQEGQKLYDQASVMSTMEQRDYDRAQTEKSRAYELAMSMLSLGVTPSAEMLASAGVSSADAQAIVEKVLEKEADEAGGNGYDNGTYSSDVVEQAQEFVGAYVDGKWGSDSAAKAKEMDYNSLAEVVAAMGGDGNNPTDEIPDKYIQKAATFKDNESLANWAYGLADTEAITEEQADQLIAENMDYNEKYITDDKGNSKISYKDMVKNTKGWEVIDEGGGNLFGIDSNAKVEAPNGEILTLKQLKTKLTEDEEMEDADARKAIKKLQQNLGISSNWFFGW